MSTKYIDFNIGTVENLRARVVVSGDAVDPTGLVVELALVAEGALPGGGDWETGTWENGGPPYYAHVLAGVGQTIDPTAGTYDLWLKLTDSPEIPIRLAGKVVVR
jgi:hypothetical protein